MTRRTYIAPGVLFLVGFSMAFPVLAEDWEADLGWEKPRKKLIELGWDIKTPAYIRQHIRAMEKLPFDGIMFKLEEENVFRDGFTWDRQWSDAELQPIMDDLAAIQWERFTDNFLLVYWGERAYGQGYEKTCDMDWFDDQQWNNILHNIKLLTQAAVAGRCKGLCFDPETYHRYPWNYSMDRSWPGALHGDTKTYEEYCAQVRKRGAQYMQAIQSVMPDIRILNLIQSVGPKPSGRWKNIMSMYHAFINGMLDAAGPEVVFIEGNEKAYSYMSKADFDAGYVDIKQRVLYLVAPENRAKYAAQVQAGSALYMDHMFGLGQRSQWIGSFLTEAQRARLFEHNIYYAFEAVDEYVWCYSEKMNWWNGPVPEGAVAAIRSAKRKIEENQELGFSMDPFVEEAEAEQKALTEATVEPERAVIGKLSTSQSAPVVDGKLDDAVWQSVDPVGPFVCLRVDMRPPLGNTTAQMTWDDEHLYVAFNCYEPTIKDLYLPGKKRDDNVWYGDSIELFIASPKNPDLYFHFMTDPANVQWDGKLIGENHNNQWNGQWRSAATIGKDHWMVELAIPWDTIDGKPKAGEKRKANLTRNRHGSPAERTTWTPFVRTFSEIQHFGTWVFDN